MKRAITGVSAVSRMGIGLEEHYAAFVSGKKPDNRPATTFDSSKYPDVRVFEVPDFEPKKYLGDKGLRTLDRLAKLMIVAARFALGEAGVKKDGQFVSPMTAERIGFVCSNAYGTLEAATELNRVAILEDARYINPAKFPNTVANSASGYVSIWEDLRAMNVTVSDGNCGALDAFAVSDMHLATGRADCFLVGGAEAMTEALFHAFRKLGVLTHATIGEGAALLLVETLESAEERQAKVLAYLTGYGTTFFAPHDERLLFASADAMESAIRMALEAANIGAEEIDGVVTGESGLPEFDEAERAGIARVIAKDVPLLRPKAWFGDTLGASGAFATLYALACFDASTALWKRESSSERIPKRLLVTTLGYYGNASAVVVERPELLS
ncbi:MAG: hypothetical protein KBF88_04200 [Polyangiaceae bacterium]|nr:hypothetical protein [Polyangiaceae bacterium]